MAEIDRLIISLIRTHGEGGVCPTANEWRAIIEIDSGPIRILNLLKFREKLHGPLEGVSGAAAYARYVRKVTPAFLRAGGEQMFNAPVNMMFGLGKGQHWDAAAMARFPSARAFTDMWLDPDFIAARDSRAEGLERSQYMVLSGG